MSENLLATLLTLAIVAAIFAWPSLLRVVCPACSRLLSRNRPTYHEPDAAHVPLRDSSFE